MSCQSVIYCSLFNHLPKSHSNFCNCIKYLIFCPQVSNPYVFSYQTFSPCIYIVQLRYQQPTTQTTVCLVFVQNKVMVPSQKYIVGKDLFSTIDYQVKVDAGIREANQYLAHSMGGGNLCVNLQGSSLYHHFQGSLKPSKLRLGVGCVLSTFCLKLLHSIFATFCPNFPSTIYQQLQ